MVNRIWQYHFGHGLVRTPSNFGKLGETPSHPGLLDWLAASFEESGWSIKQLHRLILASATYQRSSRFNQENFDKDGDNRLLWRMSPRRMEIEVWRDSLLAVTDELDRKIGGKPTDKIFDVKRRTLYTTISRNGDRFASDAFLRLFDFPSPASTAPKRAISAPRSGTATAARKVPKTTPRRKKTRGQVMTFRLAVASGTTRPLAKQSQTNSPAHKSEKQSPGYQILVSPSPPSALE